jgi:AbiJ N-terminal domain 3
MPKAEPNKITEITRRNIVDTLLLDKEPFYGRLDLVGFLRRVWPLKDMPSTDSRFDDAEGDIWQHMVDNHDWTNDHLFYDHLNVLDMPDERFVKFLEDCVHPLVSTAIDRTARLVPLVNAYLIHDGFALRASGQISGHKLYKLVSTTGADALPEAYEVVLSFAGEDREYVDEVAELLKANDVSLFYDVRGGDIVGKRPCGASSQGL